ncbi:MAG: PEP-CTERM sorting domain-containing protein [bacterium]|nr:PEP-CTERM sorting domain-containing protein [bacterium]
MALLWVGAQAQAATVSVVLSSDNSVCGNNINGACSQNGSGTYDDFGSAWSTTNGASAVLTGVGSTSASFGIDAVTAVDDGGADVGQSNDRSTFANLNFDITLTVDVDNAGDTWTVDLAQSVLGLYGLNGDGTLSAVGNQDNGNAALSSITTVVDGSNYNFSATPGALSGNPSNGSSQSQAFSGSRGDLGVVGGIGDATFSVNIDLNLTALSNDGCSGTVCSSASGGEEAAVLFGLQDVMDQDVDNYSYWSRSIGPDGYTGTFTLNVLAIPEPGMLGLLVVGMAGLVAAGRRR